MIKVDGIEGVLKTIVGVKCSNTVQLYRALNNCFPFAVLLRLLPPWLVGPNELPQRSKWTVSA